jgi:hypothetical protein
MATHSLSNLWGAAAAVVLDVVTAPVRAPLQFYQDARGEPLSVVGLSRPHAMVLTVLWEVYKYSWVPLAPVIFNNTPVTSTVAATVVVGLAGTWFSSGLADEPMMPRTRAWLDRTKNTKVPRPPA